MIHLHNKDFPTVGALLQYRASFTRWQFKDGQKGRINWYPGNTQYGIFKSDNGAQFTVSDHEVKPLGRVG